jgi:hypothetical protein
MFLGFLSLKTIFLIAHVFGAIIGAGGAYASDLMFFSSMKDKRLSSTEIRFLKIGSAMVWTGLVILYISGAALFMLDPVTYSHSPKFLAKVLIVLIITANGVLFHITHMPRMQGYQGKHLPSLEHFVHNSKFLYISGAVSMVSWTSAVFLGMVKSIPASLPLIMSVYGIAVIVASVVALLVRERFIGIHRHS